jgi:hypothetical protein
MHRPNSGLCQKSKGNFATNLCKILSLRDILLLLMTWKAKPHTFEFLSVRYASSSLAYFSSCSNTKVATSVRRIDAKILGKFDYWHPAPSLAQQFVTLF